MIRALAVIAAIALVIALRASSGAPTELALEDIGQGLETHEVKDVGRIFVLREGLLVYAWRQTTTSGKAVSYCPRERVFWSPDSNAVYDRYGNPERFGTLRNDRMVALRATIDSEYMVHIAAGKPEFSIPRERVPGAVMDFFDRWQNRDLIPTNRTLVWCPNPVR
jgi:hypothetical protein